MPYSLKGDCVVKTDTGETVPGGCHKNHSDAVAHLRALEANVNSSVITEMSMRIVKASYNKSEKTPMKWMAIDSDTDADLYQEKMSPELYADFCSRIQNETPIPEQFHDVICEQDWCGGTPYLSIAHYKAGSDLMNVPGEVESVFVDGVRLKSKGTLTDNEMGRRVWNSLREDLYMEKSGNQEHQPVRISIGFLDLEHDHVTPLTSYTFTRTDAGQICPLCSQGIGGKIYKKGQLVHLAMTRVPVNPRTKMMVENSMEEITTKKQDAASIIGDLADELEEKSIANDVLVVRSEGSAPTEDPNELTKCYNSNDGSYNQDCINSVMDKYFPEVRDTVGQPVKSASVAKALRDAVATYITKSNGETPVEDKMDEPTIVEKGVAGIPEKPFKFTQDGVTVTGDGNNTVANPVKAKVDAEDAKDGGDDEAAEGEDKNGKKQMSQLDKSFADLKNTLSTAKSVEEVQKAFNELGTVVEKSYTPPTPDASDFAAMITAAVEKAVTPLRVEIATLKAQGSNTVSNTVVKSKALTMSGMTRPEDMIQRAVGNSNQPTRKLSQIEQIARRSTLGHE